MINHNVTILGGMMKIESSDFYNSNSCHILLGDIVDLSRNDDIVMIHTVNNIYRFNCETYWGARTLYDRVNRAWQENRNSHVKVTHVVHHDYPVVRSREVVIERRVSRAEDARDYIVDRAVGGLIAAGVEMLINRTKKEMKGRR